MIHDLDRSEVLTAMTMQITVFWDVIQCFLYVGYLMMLSAARQYKAEWYGDRTIDEQ
jgi:hypothetical protein